MEFITKIFNIKNITLFILVLFCIRYIPLETRAGPSMIKTTMSGLLLLLLIIRIPKISKAVMWFGLYFVIVFILAYSINPLTFRWSTILYLFSFIIVFIFYYNQIYCERTIDQDTFISFVKKLIITYTIVLVLQQILIISGIKIFPVLNLTQILNKGIGANSLSGEPSSFARILAVLFLAHIRMLELKLGRKLGLKEIYENDKLIVCCFIWSMLTMGSGTAFIALFILSAYFIQQKYLIIILPALATLLFSIPHIEFEPLQRAYNVTEAFLSGEQENVISTDASAASRITSLMNMFTNVDYFSVRTWIGHGCDYSITFGGYNERLRSDLIGMVGEYGMLSFIVMQSCIFKCCIKKIFSLETLFWIFLFKLTFGNIAYVWGCLMIFTTVKYFQEHSINNDNHSVTHEI